MCISAIKTFIDVFACTFIWAIYVQLQYVTVTPLSKYDTDVVEQIYSRDLLYVLKRVLLCVKSPFHVMDMSRHIFSQLLLSKS